MSCTASPTSRNTVIIIEHNLDIIRNADYIVDLGPEGGEGGGTIVAQGRPEQIARVKGSYTGNFLARYYNSHKNARSAEQDAVFPPTGKLGPTAKKKRIKRPVPEKKTGVPVAAATARRAGAARMSSHLSVPGAEHTLLHTLLQEPPPRRVPHMGHAILFALLSYVLINVAGFLLVTLHAPHGAEQFRAIAQQPTLRVEAQGLAYLLTLGISWAIFPLLWDRSFSEGIRWNFAAARSFAFVLVPLGIAFGMVVQFLSGLGPSPKEMPINEFFRHSSDVWLITIFGTLLGPLYEEIAFRGFFLPAVATAYDWLSIRRTAEGFRSGTPTPGSAAPAS